MWMRYFPREIMTTRMETIVADGRVFVGTCSGNLYALDAKAGETLWSFQAGGPILHSPAVEGGIVVFGCEDGFVRALDVEKGKPVWSAPESPAAGGFCTAPAIYKGSVYLGGRNGVFYGLDAKTGDVKFEHRTGGPIRTTAACVGDRVLFASDDMHAYCLDLAGQMKWRSEKLNGQSLRDYYPVIVDDMAVLRTIPAGPYHGRIGQDRTLLVTHAGVTDHWKDIAEYTRSDATRGTPEKIESERRLVLDHLEQNPDARTFFALDLSTGKEAKRMPVLWGAGCQGTGFPPVLTNGNRAIVFYRSAFSNWTHGVAPIVAMGYLDFARAAVDPIRHVSGNAPPWNTFWGTADETMNFSVGGEVLYVCHQGTICGLDLKTLKLFYVAGNRDTWGGEPGLPWARNEWHGPARGAAAVVGNRLYWTTGSRVFCVEGDGAKGTPPDKPSPEQPTSAALGLTLPAPAEAPSANDLEKYVWETPVPPKVMSTDGPLAQRLESEVRALIEGDRLAPLYVQPGLAGREFFFDSSADVVETLSLAYPHLSPGTKKEVRAYLRKEIADHPLWTLAAGYSLTEGRRRELFDIPESFLRYERQARPHPLGNLYALWLYAERTGDRETIDANWPAIRDCYKDFVAKGWSLDPSRQDLLANRYIAGLIGYARLARGRHEESARDAGRRAAQALAVQIESFQTGLEFLRLPSIKNVAELDRFIGRGNALFAGSGHNGKIAKFLGLQPEIASAVRDHVNGAARVYLQVIDVMMPGWYLAGEERQVHFGENFVDFPDQALSIFRAKAMIERPGRPWLERRLDIPCCPGDLYFIEKTARVLEAPPAGAVR